VSQFACGAANPGCKPAFQPAWTRWKAGPEGTPQAELPAELPAPQANSPSTCNAGQSGGAHLLVVLVLPCRPSGQTEEAVPGESSKAHLARPGEINKISPFGIFVLHFSAHGSTLRLIKVLFQYSTECTGAGVNGSSAVALGAWRAYFCLRPVAADATSYSSATLGTTGPSTGCSHLG